MTPAARVQSAIEILDEVLAGTPAEKALTGWARRSRFAGSKDRAAIRDHVFDALRQRNSAALLGGGLTGRGLLIGLTRLQGQDPSEIFTGVGHAPAPLTGAEQELASASLPVKLPADLPDWMLPLWPADGAAPVDTSALRARAPVFLRVNTRKTTRDEASQSLETDGVIAVPSDVAETALVVTEGPRRIAASTAYQSGLVELQDGSSQAAVHELPLTKGMKVLDYCAGGGGKSLAMAARVDGSFFAHDINQARMRDLPARAGRAGVRVSQLKAGQAEAAGPYDLVLCDAPCSGSGTWRRTPDAKWRFTSEDLTRLQRLQGEILYEAAGLVASGGCLAFMTCSVFGEENENQVERFLAAHDNWACIRQKRWPISQLGDGFFLAVFNHR